MKQRFAIIALCTVMPAFAALFAPAAANSEGQRYEDIKPADRAGWKQDKTYEDITPVLRERRKYKRPPAGLPQPVEPDIKEKDEKKEPAPDMSWNKTPSMGGAEKQAGDTSPPAPGTGDTRTSFSLKDRATEAGDDDEMTLSPLSDKAAGADAGETEPTAGAPDTGDVPSPQDSATATVRAGETVASAESGDQKEKTADANETGGSDAEQRRPTGRKQRRRPLGPLSGEVQIKYQSANASSNEAGFLSSNGLLFFNDKIQQTTRLRVDKTFDNGLDVNGVFRDIPYQDQHFQVKVSGENGYANLGDVPTSFRGGPMTGFRKQIRGLDLEYDFGRYEVAAMLSKEKSDTSRESFRGGNIRGPYVLRANSILSNSETVYLNGSPVSRGAYNMDYFLGQITFNFIVDSTDLVEITYESIQQVSIRTGDLNGISVRAEPGWKNLELGAAYLEEGTVKSAKSTVYESIEEFGGDVFATGAMVFLEHDYVKVYSESVQVLNGDSSEYLTRGDGYTIDYFTGEIEFAALPEFATEGVEVRVNYSYYNRDFLQRIDNEELYGSGEAEHILSREWVYPGPELVYLYIEDTQARRLDEAEDYEINPANNSIIFLKDVVTPNDSENRYVVISYEIVPETEPGGGESKRRMFDLTGAIRLGKHSLHAEYAQTSSDMTLKTVQVLEERVATVGQDSGNVFPLQFDALPNTEAVYFNDTVAANSRQRAGVDYILEYDPSYDSYVLRFLEDVPAGTTIIASYKYIPIISAGEDKTGKAGRITGDFMLPFGTLKTEYMKKSAFFSPMTSYNDLERDRLVMDLKMAPKRNLFFNMKYQSQTYLGDALSGVMFDNNKLTAAAEYRFKPGARAAILFEKEDYSDNRNSALTDIAKSKIRTEFKYPFGKEKNILTEFHLEKRNQDDTTNRTSDQDVLKAGVGVNYAPDDRFRLKLQTDTSNVSIIAPPGVDPLFGNFSTRTLSNVIGVTYLPVPLWTITASIDNQSISDSRDSTKSSQVNKIRAAAASKKIGMIDSVSFGFNKTDRPNPIHGDTSTEAANLNVILGVSEDWKVTPWLSRTKAGVEERNKSENFSAGLRAAYRKGSEKGWSGTASFSSTSGKNSTLSGTSQQTWSETKSDHTRMEFSTRYLPGERYEWRNAFVFTRSASGNPRDSYSSTLDYDYSPSTMLSLLLNIEDTTYLRKKYQLRSQTRLDEHFSLGILFKREIQDGANDYAGSLFNMSLDIVF